MVWLGIQTLGCTMEGVDESAGCSYHLCTQKHVEKGIIGWDWYIFETQIDRFVF